VDESNEIHVDFTHVVLKLNNAPLNRVVAVPEVHKAKYSFVNHCKTKIILYSPVGRFGVK
jgi:hypothetical protein